MEQGGLGKEDGLVGHLEVGDRMLPPWSWGEGSSEQGSGGDSILGLRMDKIAAASMDQCKKEVWEGEARLSLLLRCGLEGELALRVNLPTE